MREKALKNAAFSLLPIGGVGEIGSNMTLVTYQGGKVLIDCGLLFPYENFFDINYLVPDVSGLDLSDLSAIVITHGHEDHIGGLTHFLKKFPKLPVYATPFTQDLIKRKTEEAGIAADLKSYRDADVLKFGNIAIHPIHVTHSIPETKGLFIRDNSGQWGALYISDFKFDLKPQHEAPFDIKKIQELAKTCAQTAFFIDSTNALVPGKTASETELLPDIESLISGKEDRLFVTLFASNVHRMSAICRFAKKHKRKIVLMGRSVEHYLRVGLAHGYMGDITEEDLWNPTQVKGETGRMLVIVSGCQGDFQSALRRLSAGEDATFKLAPGDKVVFSSKVIPGNEKQISRIMNDISEAGAAVVTAYDEHIHASGHPGQEDLLGLLQQQAPNLYFPIHGESFFLQRHQQWLREKFPTIQSEVILNWTSVSFGASGDWKLTKVEEKEPLLIHGKGLVIERTQISQRRKMACQGTVFISLDRVRGKAMLSSAGLPLQATELLPKVRELIMDRVRSDLGGRQEDYARDQIRIMTRQFFQQELGYKPVTEVHLLT
jgi:ribonuclease J